MAQVKPRLNQPKTAYWRPAQAYVLATVTLLVGVALGYLIRSGSGASGSAGPAATNTPAAASVPSPPTPAPPQAQASAVEPLLRELQARPNDPELLTQVGNAYYDNQQYEKAVPYYERLLNVRPEDVNVRTDMATAMWYTGNADGALQQFERSLRYQPTHAQTLFNLGVVLWQGKKDAKGALQTWDKLLATNPNYPDRDKVEKLMQQVRSASR